jgi:hypothetical protein
VNASYLYIVAAMALAALRFWQVPFSAPADADVYLAHIAAIAPFERIAEIDVFHALAARFVGFPAGPLPLAVWLVAPAAAAVKWLQYLLLIGSFGLFAYVARKLIGTSSGAILAVIAALCAWQFRIVHDPAIGTSLLAPWSAIVVLAAYAFWFAYRDTGKAVQLAGCYAAIALSASSGPVAWCLAALLAIVALRSDRRAAAFGACGMLVAGAVVIAASSAYWLPWQHHGGFVRNAATQFFAAVPASFRASGTLPVARIGDLYFGTRYVDDRFVYVPAISKLGWVFAILGAAAAYLAAYYAPVVSPRRLRRNDAAIVGAGFWIVPALLLGAGSEWQSGLPLGSAFESVHFEYLGFALLSSLAIEYVLSRPNAAARLAPALLALAAFIVSYGNARGDAFALAASKHLYGPVAAVARAAKAGFFNALPADAVIAPSRSLRLTTWTPFGIADPKYALFDYTGRRFTTLPYDRMGPSPSSWILAATGDVGVPVTLVHWVRGSSNAPLVDRGFGYSADRRVWKKAAGRYRGVVRSVSILSAGRSIEARRLCGAVAAGDAFVPARPSVVWGRGFVPTGPYGYNTDPPVPPVAVLGTYSGAFPQVYMGRTGAATIAPSSCPLGTMHFAFKAAASSASHLIVAVQGALYRVDVDYDATIVSIRAIARSRDPVRIEFSTDAPRADWESDIFRYDRDRPIGHHLLMQITSLWETR